MNQGQLKTCFVIQEFDKGTFDLRFTESFEPSIRQCDIEPIRADKILGLQPIIAKIEENIQKADICLADVSTDNPNVWLELGYALALDKPCVIICDSSMRERFPFDIQHRPFILYKSNSKSGFEELEKRICEAVKFELENRTKNVKYSNKVQTDSSEQDVSEYELEILGLLISKWDGENVGIKRWEIENHMRKIGYNDLSTGMGIHSLVSRCFIEKRTLTFSDGYNNEEYNADGYILNEKGLAWVSSNKNQFNVSSSKNQKEVVEDDLPF